MYMILNPDITFNNINHWIKHDQPIGICLQELDNYTLAMHFQYKTYVINWDINGTNTIVGPFQKLTPQNTRTKYVRNSLNIIKQLK